MFLKLTVFWQLLFNIGLLSTSGIQQWDCQQGYPVSNEQMACNVPVPLLIFTQGNDIFRIDSDGTNHKKIVANAGSSVLLHFDEEEERLYWFDWNRSILHRMYFNGTRRERMRGLGRGSLRFTIDWRRKLIFWANKQKGTIERTDMNGKQSRILLRNLHNPVFIVVDSFEGYLFWTSDRALSVIYKANQEGNNQTSVIEVRGKIMGLTLDILLKRIYWILYKSEIGDSSIGSCSYNGDSATVVKYLGHSTRPRVLGLSIFSDHIYYSEWNSSIRRINKYTGKDVVKISLKPSTMLISDLITVQLRDFRNSSTSPHSSGLEDCRMANDLCTNTCQMDEDSQRCRCMEGFVQSPDGKQCEDINECAHWNHGCTLGCENTPGSFYCTCPKGFVLLPDNKSCHHETPCPKNNMGCSYGCLLTFRGPLCYCPDGSVLAGDGKTCTGCTSPDNGGCSQICTVLRPGSWECHCFPGYNLQMDKKRCLASGPRPFLMFANVYDIRQMNFDGTDYESLLNSQMGRVFALDYDPVDNRIFFAHTALKWIESANMDGTGRKKLISEGLDVPEGIAVDAIHRKLYWTDRGQSCIERSNLNGKNRQRLVHENLQQPRGICIHPMAKKLFWTDIGANPKIESSNLDGSERTVIVSTDLLWPSGITVESFTDKLYWCDTKRSVIESSHLDGSNRQILSQNEVGHPFDLAVFEDHIWITDWVQPSLIRMDKRNTQNRVRLQGSMQRPSALVVVHPLAKPAISHDIFEPRKEKDEFNGTTNNETVPHDLIYRNIYEVGTEEDIQNRNILVAEILVSDESGCSDIHCDLNAHCVPLEDGPRCQCLKGFTGNGKTCNDINECSLYTAACNQQQAECLNAEGGYFCRCREGYRGNGLHCIDIDECRLGTHDCGESAVCANTEGNYTCTCSNGLPGTAVNCSETEINNSTENERVGECPPSYYGFCFNDGVCYYLRDIQEYACNCAPGYVGNRCQLADLEWWAPRVKQIKIRNISIVVCLVILLLVMGLVSFAIYYYRHQKSNKKRTFKTDTCMAATASHISNKGETVNNNQQEYPVTL
ncbi:pro-epidermal growth factor isoform X2 [Bombina bombina]|uniref:pro-epidermal growth factor isoform X2 n=1 Tax=Bombina bombina TaxID=8345 RepID=UPI00235AD546|nr:pro-epidermal growth factor isoform X2 [Bombina bombina]